LDDSVPLSPTPSFPTRRSSDLDYHRAARAGAVPRPDPTMRSQAEIVDPRRSGAGRTMVSVVPYHNPEPRTDLADPRFRPGIAWRSEEHTSELQSRRDLVCRLML